MDIVLERLVRRCSALSAATGAAVTSLAEPHRPMVLVATGTLAPYLGAAEVRRGSFLARCIETSQTVRAAGSLLVDVYGPGVTKLQLAALLYLPLVDLDGQLHGVLTLASTDEAAFPEHQRAPLESLAGAMADVLARQTAAERVPMEKAAIITESERRFRAFMSALPAAAWVKDAQGCYTFLNEQVERLWRINPSSQLGRSDFDFLPRAVAQNVSENDALVRLHNTVVRVEERVPTPDGAEHIWWVTKFPIAAEDGSVHVGGVAIDITERKVAEAEVRERELSLRKSESNLRSILENLAEGVILVRGEELLFANAAAARLFGAAAGRDLVGRTARDFVVDGERVQFDRDIERLLDNGTARATRRIRRLDGRLIEAELHASRIDYEGGSAFAITILDMTARREHEQRLQMTDRLASVGTLAAAVAHEINNPLTTIISNLSLLHEDLLEVAGPSPSSRLRSMMEMAGDAQQGAERIRRIIRSMRTLARDASPDDAGPIDPTGALDAAVQLTANEIRHRATLVRDVRALPQVIGDETRLTQVFVNLLANAGQAIDPGDPARSVVRLSAHTGPAGEAVIEVTDNGAGIPADLRGRIFDPFFTTKPMGQGTGLGLSIVHNIVAAMGGRVSVESEVGRGSTFRVTLPGILREPPTARSDGRVGAGMSAVPEPARPVVLVVDDEEPIGRALRRLLQSNYDVVLASSAEEALAVLAQRHIDVVLSDLMMPGTDGVALFAEIERRHPAMASKVIFLSGGAFRSSVQAFLERISNQRLEKPIDHKQLQAAVASLLR